MIVEGHMQYVWDETGRRYLDAFAGIVTISVGHCHPKIVERVREQTGRLQHTTTIYLHPTIVQMAEKLAEKMPPGLTRSYFTNSGSEANEIAILSAREYTGNQDVIALRNGYHGGTSVPMSLTAARHLEVQDEQRHERASHAGRLLLPLPVRARVSVLRREVCVRHQERHPIRNAGRDRVLHRRADSGRRRRGHAAEGVLQDRLRHRPRARRHLHRRRSARRLRPHRPSLLVPSELGRRAGHDHDGQGHRQRRTARRR